MFFDQTESSNRQVRNDICLDNCPYRALPRESGSSLHCLERDSLGDLYQAILKDFNGRDIGSIKVSLLR